MEMQFEDGRWDENVLDALQAALLSLTDAVGMSDRRREAEIFGFDQGFRTMGFILKPGRAG